MYIVLVLVLEMEEKTIMGWFSKKNEDYEKYSRESNYIDGIELRIEELERKEKLSRVIKRSILETNPRISRFHQALLVRDDCRNYVEIMDSRKKILINFTEQEAIDLRDFLMECYPIVEDCCHDTGDKNDDL